MTARTAKSPSPNLATWKSGGIVEAELPSGMTVKIRPLRLEHYLSYGRTPDPLRVIALQDLRDKIGDTERQPPHERAKAWQEYTEAYVIPAICQLVIEPELKPDDIPDLPPADVDWFTGVLNMRITEDARGRPFGPEPLDRYAIFREKHSCPDDCAACREVLSEVSAVVG